jgi:hypothetical protein
MTALGELHFSATGSCVRKELPPLPPPPPGSAGQIVGLQDGSPLRSGCQGWHPALPQAVGVFQLLASIQQP